MQTIHQLSQESLRLVVNLSQSPNISVNVWIWTILTSQGHRFFYYLRGGMDFLSLNNDPRRHYGQSWLFRGVFRPKWFASECTMSNWLKLDPYCLCNTNVAQKNSSFRQCIVHGVIRRVGPKLLCWHPFVKGENVTNTPRYFGNRARYDASVSWYCLLIGSRIWYSALEVFFKMICAI